MGKWVFGARGVMLLLLVAVIICSSGSGQGTIPCLRKCSEFEVWRVYDDKEMAYTSYKSKAPAYFGYLNACCVSIADMTKETGWSCVVGTDLYVADNNEITLDIGTSSVICKYQAAVGKCDNVWRTQHIKFIMKTGSSTLPKRYRCFNAGS